MRTVVFGESQHARAVNDDEEITTAQAIAVEHFLADQGFDRLGDHVLHLRGFQAFESLIQAIAVRTRLDVEQGLELGR
jgi:hypothetical protein